ncbi:CAP domain-containing protein [Lactobacillus sp. PSON]|uniref:CAP domain-containing protein n=1 Tax=Lactobacillus sp. PSON TaxID=3455454 RepID=UPI00404376A0
MLFKKFTFTAALILLAAPLSINTTQAATFTTGEIKQVHHFQHEYASLNKKNYNASNIYSKTPHLTKKFKVGQITNRYADSQLDYINYYRSLFGLTPVTENKLAQKNAQKTAAVMAAINANPFVNQHGLPNETKPSYVSKSMWKVAQDTSETSNLNFNVSNQSAGDVITDLVTDHYNLSGSDTGHRAWILSSRLSTTGVGAAYGSNGYRYSVQKVLNVDDLFRDSSQPIVAYPSSGLFPIELSKGKNVAWSLYLSDKTIKNTPNITITDLDTKQNYKATNVTNYSSSGYGNFKTVLTYSPDKTPIIAGHQYKIKIGNVYTYKFKLFKQDTNTEATTTPTAAVATPKPHTYQYVSAQQRDTNMKSDILLQGEKSWATLSPKNDTTNHQPQNYFDILKKGQWHRNFFMQNPLY